MPSRWTRFMCWLTGCLIPPIYITPTAAPTIQHILDGKYKITIEKLN